MKITLLFEKSSSFLFKSYLSFANSNSKNIYLEYFYSFSIKYGTLRMNCFSQSFLKLDYIIIKNKDFCNYYNYFYVNLTYSKVIYIYFIN